MIPSFSLFEDSLSSFEWKEQRHFVYTGRPCCQPATESSYVPSPQNAQLANLRCIFLPCQLGPSLVSISMVKPEMEAATLRACKPLNMGDTH